MNYAIIGTGAIGGYYGAKLAQAGKEVHFLLRSDYEHVAANGLKIQSCDGSFVLPKVNAYRQAADMPPCDVVIVALKTTNNPQLASLLPPLLKPDTLVLLIQNGIGVEEDVARMFPDVALAGGLAFICAAKHTPGVIEHQALGNLAVAPYRGDLTGKAARLVEEWVEAGIRTRLAPYDDARWQKALWNIPFNGLCVAMNATTDQLVNDPDACKVVSTLMDEVIATANALGVNCLSRVDADKMIEMTRGMLPYKPSMMLDFHYRRPMEIEYIYTHPIAKALEAGVSVPAMQMLESQLRFFDKRQLE